MNNEGCYIQEENYPLSLMLAGTGYVDINGEKSLSSHRLAQFVQIFIRRLGFVSNPKGGIIFAPTGWFEAENAKTSS